MSYLSNSESVNKSPQLKPHRVKKSRNNELIKTIDYINLFTNT